MNATHTTTKDAKMDLAARIAARPDAYLSRFNKITTARKVATDNKVVNGRCLAHRIFHGPIDLANGNGEFWMTSSATISKALRDAGYEMVEVV